MRQPIRGVLAAALIGCAIGATLQSSSNQQPVKNAGLDLGAFSVSLTVKDLAVSRAFYQILGFAVVGGAEQQNWLILRNGTTTIGLFQGMFEKNSLTFNPGWSSDAKPLDSYTDVRDLQRQLEAAGLKPTVRADEGSTGPAFLVLTDPDGNPILIDQHVPTPK